VSYAKARAEGLGMTCNVGIAERSERLVTALVTTGLAGLFHAPWIQAAGLVVLAAATLVTVVQRLVHVHGQATVADTPPGAPS
jgi:CDP-diacylglycerol---glycerol-3-phosphate 3-phosphatidyltransferase